MLYLMLRIALYLIAGTAMGAAAGYLFRHVQAKRVEESLTSALTDTKAKLPQQDTLLRTRDEMIAELKAAIDERKEAEKESDQQRQELEKQIKQLTAELRRAEAQKAATTPLSLDELDDDLSVNSTAETSALREKIKVLEAKLASAGSDGEIDSVRRQLEQRDLDYQSLAKLLEHKDKTIADLERERELQQRSLQVLHQQLENERTRLRA